MSNSSNFSGNIGEWSEVYVLLRLLADGKLVTAGADHAPNPNLYFPLTKVLREEGPNKDLEFVIDRTSEKINVLENGKHVTSVDQSVFGQEALILYEEMNATHDKPSFPAEHTEYFITSLGCESIKASSNDKTDITVQIHDPQTGYEPVSGFSIKSQVGSPSTLLNATKATNFTYKVNGLNDADIAEINAIEGSHKIIDRMSAVFSRARSVVFSAVDNEIFARNLMLIDSKMAEIVAEALIVHYRDNIKSISKVIEILEEDNPLGFPSEGFYRYKMKKLLCAIALGFQPAKSWDGTDEANGGYIVVTSSGDVVAYHIYNRSHFEDYLLESTKFERGSTGRHGFASLYKENGSTYLKLNLQVRF